ncbi:Pyruvate dehydrogenase complex repressor [Pandoraea pneumonica]|jgi:GntR family transcriptional repressor for pyruvate dehydrogenase complex|uniref:Pyruvate dehydrogenase complex repressor n=1 Tax=Pandoraea pneumonica TaxID=2508299 RepID=A0A5E4X012_9BURK|nr:FadR/GntR family transcriptional regulator [Pandoraea pneumonica]VVE29608.1 Pyruvate dehydrogenase complex repressor [Pandoraea pneumonica]
MSSVPTSEISGAVASFAPVTPPPRLRLSDMVYEQLETMVVEGRLAPGSALPSERDLAQQMGVSRPSLREALLRLESRGLIVGRAGGGYLVANASQPLLAEPLSQLMSRHSKTVDDVLEMREVLEAKAVELAAERATPEDIARLGQALEALEAAYAAGRDGLDDDRDGGARGASLLTRVPELDAHFHLALAEATHNLVLVHLMHAIFELLRGSVVDNYRAIVGHGADLAELIGQHRRIFDAVASHDAASAQRALREHLTFIRDNSGDSSGDTSAV